MNRFSKICLVIIILLLAVIAVRPLVSPQPTIAAVRYQYLVVETQDVTANEVQKIANQQAAEGWEFVAPTVSEREHAIILIFRKAQR